MLWSSERLELTISILSTLLCEPEDKIKELLSSGLLEDLLKFNSFGHINPRSFRKVIGLEILRKVGVVDIRAARGNFVAKDHILERYDRISIHHIREEFRKLFLGKIESPLGKTSLEYSDLVNCEVDDNYIIDEIGGKSKAESYLQQIFALLEKQPKGEFEPKEVLLGRLSGHNIFYVRDIKGVLQAVNLYWSQSAQARFESERGWYFTCNKIGEESRRHTNNIRVFYPAK